MKRLLASLLLIGTLGFTGVTLAEEAVPAVVMEAASAAVEGAAAMPAEAAPAEVAPAEAPAEAAPPVPDKGDTTWMMLSTLLVILMIVPGVALFYGGLVRAKNMLSSPSS